MRVFLLCVVLLFSSLTYAERIQDLTNISGVRQNHLIGYGVVVGLDGSGDQTNQLPFAAQSLTSLLSHMGVSIQNNNPGQIKNIATVIITADLPAFAQPGQQIDVTVSSIGNAKSLRGGTLLMTPLRGLDGQIYAIAQGSVVVSGASAEGPQSRTQINHLSVGLVPNGAQIERAVPTDINSNDYIELELKTQDFGMVRNITHVINQRFNKHLAQALDGRRIHVKAPIEANARVNFIADIQALQVNKSAQKAQVIINARTGSIVMTKEVTVEECAVAHGNLTVSISASPVVSQPNPFSFGKTVEASKDSVSISKDKGHLIRMKEESSLSDVVRALNTLGASPQDLIAILQAMQSAGALNAELRII